MPGSTLQTIRPPTEVALQDRRRSPHDPPWQAPTRARAAKALPRRGIALSRDPVRRDEDLVREINVEQGHVETHKRNTIQDAIRCGELLLEMKERVGRGHWFAWVGEHFEASESTAVSVPARLPSIRRSFGQAARDQLDDHRASEVLYKASREARQAATELERTGRHTREARGVTTHRSVPSGTFIEAP
jgi:hypothetical protein